jgi:hypothetical protein
VHDLGDIGFHAALVDNRKIGIELLGVARARSTPPASGETTIKSGRSSFWK